jgi:heptosyltransferase-3
MRRLIIRPGAIGDCIVSLPAIEHLRANYTEVWVAAQNVPLIRFADRVDAIQSTGLNLIELGLAPERLHERLAAFDDIVSWYGAARGEFREAVRRLPFRFLDALPRDTAEHASDFYLRQVGASPGGVPRIEVPRWEGGFAAIHPFSGSASKNWPLGSFRRLAERLGKRIEVRWCAGPEEALDGAVRFDNLYEVARWLAGARLFVGNDSGIAHLAAAAGTPVVALFGETDPAVWAPRGKAVRTLRNRPLQELDFNLAAVTCEEMIAPS